VVECTCDRGFWGADCAGECPGGTEHPCGDHGYCTEQGSCDCFARYIGTACYSCVNGFYKQVVGDGAFDCRGGAS
jgi:hypothetical protein